MNHASFKGRSGDYSLICLELNVIPATLTLTVDLKCGADCVPGVLLGMQLCWRLTLISFERNFVTGLAACGWRDKFNN